MTQLEKAARAALKTLDEDVYVGDDRFINAVTIDGTVDVVAFARAVIASIEVDDAMVEVAHDAYFFGTAETAYPDERMRTALTASLRSILEDGAGR